MELKLVKLINGDDVITGNAEPVQDSKEPLVRLSKATMLAQTPQGVGLISWPQFSASDQIEVRASMIITVTDIHNEQITSMYDKFTGRIVTPTKPALIV